MNCAYCYVPDYNRKETKPDDTEVLYSLKLLINKFEQEGYGIGAFCFHGAEPSLLSANSLGNAVLMINEHWDKFDISGLEVAIQSNGKRFSEYYLNNLLRIIKKPEKLRLGFSIDPPEQVHDLLRDNSYQTVFDNYETSMSLGFPVSVLSVVSKNTMNWLDEFAKWMKEQMNLKKTKGNPYRIKIKFATGELALNEEEMMIFSGFLIENDLLSLPQVFTPGYCLQNGNDCIWYEFDIKGNCYSCNKTYNDEGIFANWKGDSFSNIIEKRKTLYHSFTRNEECETCPYELLCNSGCPADRFETGEMSGKANECTLIKKVYGHIINNPELNLIEFYNNNN